VESEETEIIRLRKENHRQLVSLHEVRRALVAANGGEDAVPRNVSLVYLVDALAQMKTRYFNGWEETRNRLVQARKELEDLRLGSREEVSQD
jgi:hypothetical protein